jgi:hypothetical protein
MPDPERCSDGFTFSGELRAYEFMHLWLWLGKRCRWRVRARLSASASRADTWGSAVGRVGGGLDEKAGGPGCAPEHGSGLRGSIAREAPMLVGRSPIEAGRQVAPPSPDFQRMSGPAPVAA